MRFDDFSPAPIYYFAYGMLTDPRIMEGAEYIGPAILKNHELEFRGYANVYPGQGNVTGVLWALDRRKLAELDVTEGYPHLYDRKTYPVIADGQRYEAMVYTMTPRTREQLDRRKPSRSYIMRLVKGYNNAGIPLTQISHGLQNRLDEVRMSPQSFQKAVATGAAQGVLVGFEFEVCMPDAQATYGPSGEPSTEPQSRVQHTAEETALRLIEHGDLRIEIGGGMPNGGRLTFARFDELFKPKPGTPYANSRQAYDAIRKNALAMGMELFNEIPEKYREKYVQQAYNYANNTYRRTDGTTKRLEFLWQLSYMIMQVARHGTKALDVAVRIRHAIANRIEDWDDLLARWIGLPIRDRLYDNERESAQRFLETFDFDPDTIWEEFDLDSDDEYEYDSDPDYRKGVDRFAPALQQTMGMPVEVFDDYHQRRKKPDRWYIEPDGSLAANMGDIDFEVVGPPMPADQAMVALGKFYQLAAQWKLYTSADNNTGLHINVSIPKDIDILKLAVFSGDQYVLQQFGRSNNEWAKSVERDVARDAQRQEYKINTKTGRAALERIAQSYSREHKASINFNGQYVSFRQAGGDYLSDYQAVVNTVGRFVQAVQIASDPQAYRNEYLTKLAQITNTVPASQFSKKYKPTPGLNIVNLIRNQGIPAVKLSILVVDDKPDATAKAYIRQLSSRGWGSVLPEGYKIVKVIPNSEDARQTLLPKYLNYTKQQEAKSAPASKFITVLLAQPPGTITAKDFNSKNQPYADSNQAIFTGARIIRGIGTVDSTFIPISDPVAKQYLQAIARQLKPNRTNSPKKQR